MEQFLNGNNNQYNVIKRIMDLFYFYAVFR